MQVKTLLGIDVEQIMSLSLAPGIHMNEVNAHVGPG